MGIINRAVRNISRRKIRALLVIISIPAGVLANQQTDHTERLLLLKDGKIIKEKVGLHQTKKNNKCPNCGGIIQTTDEICPICKKPILFTEEPFSL
jgi:hypothetical protein